MKSKITKPVKILGACVIGIILCLGIYYFVDYILNGSFVDWFEEHLPTVFQVLKKNLFR